MTKFEVFYQRNKRIIEAHNLYQAKLKAIELFRVPKNKQGLIAIQSIASKEQKDFMFL